MTFNINSITFEQIPSQIVEIWEKLAEDTSQFEFLDWLTKVELSRYASQKEWSEAQRQRLAYADILFSNHLDLVKQARKDMLIGRARMQALESKFELERSLNATKRSEMRIN